MIDFIKHIAREAGRIAVYERKNLSDAGIHSKTTDKDLVTVVDRKLEEFLISEIHRRFPGHGICGEETGVSHAESECRWIIDPIDGTTSYIHDLPFFSISIAFQRDRKTVVGVVNAPRLDEIFSAEKGKGAFLNDKPIKVSRRGTLRKSLLATGFACVRANLAENNLKYLARVLPSIRGIRRNGSAALDLCYVACGRFEGFWELNLNLYDIAAGVLILEEAGGVISDLDGKSDFPKNGLVAANNLIQQELLNKLHEA